MLEVRIPSGGFVEWNISSNTTNPLYLELLLYNISLAKHISFSNNDLSPGISWIWRPENI